MGVVESAIDVKSSNGGPDGVAHGALGVDRLSALLERFRVRAALFHTGALCGVSRFDAVPGRGFLHILRHGAMEVLHRPARGEETRLRLEQPTLLFYPRPLRHAFINPAREGSDFTCATLDFDGGEHNPIVHALPAIISVPLAQVAGVQAALALLFAEADHPRCGSRLLVDGMFEVVLIQLLRWIVDHPQRVGIRAGLFAGLADPRLARALVAMHQAPHEDWPLQRMAAQAGMSRSAFAECFRAATGATPANYLTDWRLSLASSMVRAGQPLKLVAAELGFASASSLSRAFSMRLGASPRRWRAQTAAA